MFNQIFILASFSFKSLAHHLLLWARLVSYSLQSFSATFRFPITEIHVNFFLPRRFRRRRGRRRHPVRRRDRAPLLPLELGLRELRGLLRLLGVGLATVLAAAVLAQAHVDGVLVVVVVLGAEGGRAAEVLLVVVVRAVKHVVRERVVPAERGPVVVLLGGRGRGLLA